MGDSERLLSKLMSWGKGECPQHEDEEVYLAGVERR